MRKTPIWQFAILALMLGLLIFAVVRMVGQMSTPKKRAAPAAGPSTATDMPPVPGTLAERQAKAESQIELAGQMNPNLFKVFELMPPKNPFVAKEEWFADVLQKMPGYPEIRDSNYFDSMDPYLPDMGLIYDDPEAWSSVTIQRQAQNSYSIAGTSEDGLIKTQIEMMKDIPTEYSYTWEKASGTPLTALQNPDWVKQQIALAESPEEVAPPDDLFGGEPPPGGLPIPGSGAAAGVATGMGDSFSCYGVSSSATSASALINFNGQPRLITTGMVLPTRYKVLEINQDGVILVDIESAESVWVPLSGQ